MVLQLENVIVRLHLLAGLLGGQPGLAGLLLADESGPAGRFGDPDARHASFLLGRKNRTTTRDCALIRFARESLGGDRCGHNYPSELY